MREIPLTQGKVALVDDADYAQLSQWKWHAQKDRRNWYAAHSVKMPGDKHPKLIMMHRLLCAGSEIDHKNGNGLDNQRYNLRPATGSQNAGNRKPPSTNRTGYKGVSWVPRLKKFRTLCARHHLGYFKLAIDAAVAYDQAAERYFGEFARLNFVYDPACYI